MATSFLQQLQQQVANMRQSLFDQGVLVEADFLALQALNINGDPDYTKDLLGAFIRLSSSSITSIEDSLKKEPIDGETIAGLVNGLKSSALGIGAGKIRGELDRMKEYCQLEAWESLKASCEVLKQENAAFKNAIQPYLQLLDRLSYARRTNRFAGDH